MNDHPRRWRFGALALIGTLVFAACGSDDDTSADTERPAAESSGSAGESDGGSAEPIQENGPVVVSGIPLEPYDSSIPDGSIGADTPVADGESFDGSPITIGGATENATMYVFLAHWCPHCNDEIPELLALDEAGELPPDLEIVGISTAVAADRPNYPPSEWIDERGWIWPILADDEELTAMISYGGTGFPFVVLAASDGTVLARRAGSASAEETKAWIDQALA